MKPFAAKPNPEPPPSRRKTAVLAALLVATTLVAYMPAFGARFIWDDDRMLTQNTLVQSPDGLGRIWFSTEPIDYFPLTLTSFWLEWRLWGMNAAGYHAVNVILHALSALLLWRMLLRLKIPGAWLGAMLFAVHPVTVASVAWITERKNTLSLLFYLLATLCYLRFEDSKRRMTYLAALGLFLLALLSKTSTVVLAPALLLLVLWQGGKLEGRDWARTAPFFALALALGLVEMWFQQTRAIADVIVRPEGFLSRLAAAGWAVWFYLYKAFLPIGLAMVYPRWTVDPHSILAWLPLAALLALLGLLWHCRRGWGRGPLMAMAYFLVALFPVLGFFDMAFTQYSLVADHWQYLALIGPMALVGGLVAGWTGRWGPAGREARVAVAAALVVMLGGLTWTHAVVFEDEQTLWADTVAKNPACWAGYNNFGNAILAKGKVQEALACYNEAARLNPKYVEAQYNLGNVLFALRRNEEAEAHYREALRLNPKDVETQNNYGWMLYSLGRVEEAMEHYRAALRVEPNMPRSLANLAWALATINEPALRNGPEAVTLAERACEGTDYANASYLDALAAAYAEVGRYTDAERTAARALDVAQRTGRADLMGPIESRRQLYAAGKPYHEPRRGAR